MIALIARDFIFRNPNRAREACAEEPAIEIASTGKGDFEKLISG
jgi:hypothetical protein